MDFRMMPPPLGIIHVPRPGIHVSERAFLAVQWTITGLSLLFVCFRLFVRIASLHRLFLDDYLVLISWTILLATAVILRAQSSLLYRTYDIMAGHIPPEDWTPEFQQQYNSFIRYIVPLTVLFYTSLWCVKFSLLAFFYKLGSKIKAHRIWWWVVLVVTFLAWIASIADMDYKCSLGGLAYILTECPRPSRVRFQRHTFYANYVSDILTDLMSDCTSQSSRLYLY
ncbi:hypothetical protein BDW59DRAFT_35942 [Aspergillus cavernicola]|uniref:Rhodopsin domain-containing protein n=1 Tax=Aspergillus cavernicola TaxID=176166 RepID=A0ABR4INW6_9EURO